MSEIQMRARYTGNREICYRWVGVVGSGEVRHAQSFPGVEIVADTWSDSVDARVARSTKVRLPAGLLVIDSATTGGTHAYTAGILDGADAKNTINWARARYVETKHTTEKKDGREIKRTIHVVEVDGVRGQYVEVAS